LQLEFGLWHVFVVVIVVLLLLLLFVIIVIVLVVRSCCCAWSCWLILGLLLLLLFVIIAVGGLQFMSLTAGAGNLPVDCLSVFNYGYLFAFPIVATHKTSRFLFPATKSTYVAEACFCRNCKSKLEKTNSNLNQIMKLKTTDKKIKVERRIISLTTQTFKHINVFKRTFVKFCYCC